MLNCDFFHERMHISAGSGCESPTLEIMLGYCSLVLVSPPVGVVLLLDMNPKDIGFRKAWATRPLNHCLVVSPPVRSCKHRLNCCLSALVVTWYPLKSFSYRETVSKELLSGMNRGSPNHQRILLQNVAVNSASRSAVMPSRIKLVWKPSPCKWCASWANTSNARACVACFQQWRPTLPVWS